MDGSDSETIAELELHLNQDEILDYDLSPDGDQASGASEPESIESEQQSEPAPKRISAKEVKLWLHQKASSNFLTFNGCL